MNVIDAINILKKYGRYNDAQNECKRKKIDEAPYDMQGHHKIYCCYLFQIWSELRNKKETLLKVKCSEFDNIPDNLKLVHGDCYSVSLGCTREHCKTKCKYYQKNIAVRCKMKLNS